MTLAREPVGRGLFREDPQGDLEINLVYDQRQQNLDQIKRLNQGRGSPSPRASTKASM